MNKNISEEMENSSNHNERDKKKKEITKEINTYDEINK